MKRTFSEKIQSTKLHQSWSIGILSTLLLLKDYITPEIWLGAITVAFGGYAYSNVQQHKIYGNGNGAGIGVDDP